MPRNSSLPGLDTYRDLVEFYAEESQIVLPRLLDNGRRFDFAFIDGSLPALRTCVTIAGISHICHARSGGVVVEEEVSSAGAKPWRIVFSVTARGSTNCLR